MNRKIVYWCSKGFFVLLLIVILFLQARQLLSQSNSEYHFVYIDVFKTNDLSNLQSQLDSLFIQIKDQKFVFYLSNQNKPVIVTEEKQFKKLKNSIYNITTSVPEPATDIKNINLIFKENEFLYIESEQKTGETGVKSKYNKIIWHFFLSPISYNNMNLKKYLIDYLIYINFANSDVAKPEVNVYFELEELKSLAIEDISSMEESGFKILKY